MLDPFQAIAQVISVFVAIWAIQATAHVGKANEEARKAEMSALENRNIADILKYKADNARRDLDQSNWSRALADGELDVVRSQLNASIGELLLSQYAIDDAKGEVRKFRLQADDAAQRLNVALVSARSVERSVIKSQISTSILSSLNNKLLYIGEGSSYRALFGDSTRGGSIGRYKIFSQQMQDPYFCPLAGGGTFVSVGPSDQRLDVRIDPLAKSLCEGLSKSGIGTPIEIFVLNHNGIPVSEPYQWMRKGGSYDIEIHPYTVNGVDYSRRSIEYFWDDVDIGVLLRRKDENGQYFSETPTLSVDAKMELNSFHEGWPAFVNIISSIEYDNALRDHHNETEVVWRLLGYSRPRMPESGNDDIDRFTDSILDREAPPSLGRVRELSVESARRGDIPFTKNFDRDLVCAGAWYAELSGFIDRQDRLIVCMAGRRR